jgi:protein-tyrosine phosphatase
VLFGKKNKIINEGFRSLVADMHSHLLPGIDDGATDLPTAVELVKGLIQLGFSKLITTPHIMQVLHPNSPHIILEKLEELKQELNRQQIGIDISAAAEYFLDDAFAGQLQQKAPLLTFGNNYVLVEFSLANPSFGTKEMLFELQMQGYVPVIAHPERYLYLWRNREFYDEMKASGCLFQVNLLSLAGYYGKAENEMAHYLLRKNYVDLLGTDVHHARHLATLHNEALISTVHKLMESGQLLNAEL